MSRYTWASVWRSLRKLADVPAAWNSVVRGVVRIVNPTQLVVGVAASPERLQPRPARQSRWPDEPPRRVPGLPLSVRKAGRAPVLRRKRPCQVSQPALGTQRGDGVRQEAHGKVEGADTNSRAAEQPRSCRTARRRTIPAETFKPDRAGAV